MGKIAVLSDILCNQIAAGEVVERPAAVVKELMENSLDARSAKITVSLFQGGRKEIRVVDDGRGMNPEDAFLALERHATSKIKTLNDLQSIRSLGFRGEALPSIAAVSRLELVTRERESVSGSRIAIEGGILKKTGETGCPPGTSVTVRDLFFNLPARRKFLRSVDTEMSHIGDQFLRLSVAHPSVHFQLSHQGRTVYDFPSASNLLQRTAQVLGRKLAESLQPFSHESREIRVHGLAGPPELQRANTQSLFFYINGRPFRDRLVNQAVLWAYDTLLPKGRFPVVALFLEMSPNSVDVNVHPTKREIRFRNLGDVQDTVRQALREALGELQSRRWQRPLADNKKESGSSGGKGYLEQDRVIMEPAGTGASSPTFPKAQQTTEAPPAPPPAEEPSTNSEGLAESPADSCSPQFSRLPFLGQLGNAYLLLEAPDGLLLIDQHAAHERIVFDRLQSLKPKESPAQRLMKPLVMDFLPKEAELMRRWEASLKEAGFEIEPFGGDTFVVHAVPAALSRYDPEGILRGLLTMDAEGETKPESDTSAALAKTAACHGAIRSGRKLQPQEIRQLLQDLDGTPVSATCPHGRPLWWKLTYGEIARFFRRL